jgi:hypothetical protein
MHGAITGKLSSPQKEINYRSVLRNLYKEIQYSISNIKAAEI